MSPPPGRPKAGSALQAAPSRDATPIRSVHPRAGGDGAADLSPLGRRVVFVYYRILSARVPALLEAFAKSMADVGGWNARLMRKVDGLAGRGVTADEAGQAEDGVQTWMEVYSLADEVTLDVQPMIERLAFAAGIVDLVDGERHYEIFEPCA